MPGMDGTGPAGAGARTGRGFGACTAARPAGFGPGLGRGGGFGAGRAMGWGPGYSGRGRGLGRCPGWFSVGYGEPGEGPVQDMRTSLKERSALLRAELERTEAIIKSIESDTGATDTGK